MPKLEGYVEVESGILALNHLVTIKKQLLKHNHLEKTLVLKQILVLVLRWPQKMKTMKLWSLIGLTCLLVHIIRAEDQVNKSIPR